MSHTLERKALSIGIWGSLGSLVVAGIIALSMQPSVAGAAPSDQGEAVTQNNQPGGISIGGNYSPGKVPKVGAAPAPRFDELPVDPNLVPELIPATGQRGVAGFMKREDYLGGAVPASPAEAIRQQEERNKSRRPLIIPIYASDGTTVVDKIEFAWQDQAKLRSAQGN